MSSFSMSELYNPKKGIQATGDRLSKNQTPAKSETELPEWMVPYAKDYLGTASNLADKPYTPYSGQTVAGMNPLTQEGLGTQAQLGRTGTAAGNAGAAGLMDTLSGKWLNPNSNPYLTGQIDSAQGDVVRNYNNVVKPATETAMANSGSFGNSGLLQMQQGQQSDLQRNLGNISTQMRGNAYTTERGYMNSALSMVPQYDALAYGNAAAVQDAGKAMQTQQQSELTDQYQRFLDAQGWDVSRLNLLGNALGVLKPGVGTTTQTGAQGSAAQSVLGGAVAGAGAGSAAGPYGALIGGVIGGAGGYFSRPRG